MSFSPKIVNVDGLRVVLIKDDRQSITVRALVGTGSREETDVTAGSAHFLEHFVFKGTKKYPKVVGAYIDSLGGWMDAYTSHDSVSFTVKLGKEKLVEAMDIIGGLVGEPLLPDKFMATEKKIISEEIKFRNDEPQIRSFMEVWKLMYHGHNLGREIAGTFETVGSMTVAKLRDYMDKWFVAENTIVGVVGNWRDEKAVLAQIEKSFARVISRGKLKQTKNDFQEGGQARPLAELVERKGMEQASVCLGFRSFRVGHELETARDLMNILLGRAWFSRLLKEVREKRGLAYTTGSEVDELKDTGNIVLWAGLPKGKIGEAVELIREIVFGLGGGGKWGISEKELKLVKECEKGRIGLRYDAPEGNLDLTLHDLMLRNRVFSADELRKLVDGVTLEQVREVCRQTFSPLGQNWAVVGDYDKLPFEI